MALVNDTALLLPRVLLPTVALDPQREKLKTELEQHKVHLLLHTIRFVASFTCASMIKSTIRNWKGIKTLELDLGRNKTNKQTKMGFRFSNLNPIYRACIARLSSSSSHKRTTKFPNRYPLKTCVDFSENPPFRIPRRGHFGHSNHDHDHHHHFPQNQKEVLLSHVM